MLNKKIREKILKIMELGLEVNSKKKKIQCLFVFQDIVKFLK